MAKRRSPSTPPKSKALSWLAGGGSGSGFVVWIDNLSLSPDRKLLLQAAIPWGSALIGIAAPLVYSFISSQARYFGVWLFLCRAKRQAAAVPDDDVHAELRKKATANVVELQQMLMDLNTQSAKNVVDISS